MKNSRSVLISLLLAPLPCLMLAMTPLLRAHGGVAHADEPTKVTPSPASDNPVWKEPRLIPPAPNGVGVLVPNLAFNDLSGAPHKLTATTPATVTVIAFTSSSCPVSLKYAPALARLETQYAGKNVRFVFVDPVASDTPAELKAMATTQHFKGAVMRDTSGTMARTLGAKMTTEAFVLDGARTLVYRGAVSDQYGFGYSRDTARHNYLADAIDAVLAGKTPDVPATDAPGCALATSTTPTATPHVTYNNRISRIMNTHCVECHHEGGIAPFPLDNMPAVLAHAGAIQQAVERKSMPPWSAAPPKDGHATLWVNDRSLPARDKTDLVGWLSGDKAAGNPADAPLPRTFATGWKIGKPDAVFELPSPVAVKAEGVMPYVTVEVPTHFTEDKWVSGLEIQPTARGVVHHVLVFAGAGGEGRLGASERDGFLAGYVPGTSSFIYPDGFAKKIPAGAVLRFQLHYTPNGTAAMDQTKLGIKFASKPPEHEVKVAGIAGIRLNIPPGDANHPEKASVTVPDDAKILAFMPHMHVRGKACEYDLVAPDGTKQVLLDVPHYDFNWQHYYRYADPVDAPKGSRVEFTGWFDNSAGNPANPDPNKTVHWGPQTTDEMLLGYVEYYLVNPESTKSISGPIGGGQGIEALFKQLDKNGDGKLSRDEFPRPALFDRADTNHDGFVTLEEAQALLGGRAVGGGLRKQRSPRK